MQWLGVCQQGKDGTLLPGPSPQWKTLETRFCSAFLMEFDTSAVSWALFSSRSFLLLIGHHLYFICVCDVFWNQCFPFQ